MYECLCSDSSYTIIRDCILHAFIYHTYSITLVILLVIIIVVATIAVEIQEESKWTDLKNSDIFFETKLI